MIMAGIALAFSLALCGLALLANVRFRRIDRLPMQWSLTGKVTWSASRPMALAFLPALTALVFAAQFTLALNVPPRVGQEGLVIPTFIGVGVTALLIQLLHFWLIERTVRQR